MKNLIFILIFLSFSFTALCQGGVNFEQLTFDEALSKAKAENKLVFMDCYTTWCAPCKYMADNVFPREEAGEFFNPKFVSVKFDMENGEGKELAQKFGVRAYPTFLIIRPDGSVQHRIVGGVNLDKFIEIAERGLNVKTSFDYLDRLHEKGKMNKKQLISYQIALNDAYEEEKSNKVAQELKSILKEKDKMQKEYWPILEKESFGSDGFKLVLNNLSTFRKNVGKEKIDNYLFENYFSTIGESLNADAKPHGETLKQIKSELENLDIDGKDVLLSTIELNQACLMSDINKIISIAEKINTNENGALWSAMEALGFIKNKASKDDLKRILRLEEQYMNLVEDDNKEFVKDYFADFKIAMIDGVNFQDLSFEEALEIANQQGRFLFVDCNTSWCEPCRYMENVVFKQENVRNFMNANFVCVKYDLEKGEGPMLAKRFGIRSFPTFLLVEPDGSLRNKIVGGTDSESFVALVKEGLDDNTALGSLMKKYDNGERDKKFLATYIRTLVELDEPIAKEVANELFKILNDEERFSDDYWFVFGYVELCPYNSEIAKFLTANLSKFYQTIGKEKVDSRLRDGYMDDIMKVISGREKDIDMKRLNVIGQEIKTLKLSDEKTILSAQLIAKAIKMNDVDRLLIVCEKEIPNLGTCKDDVVYYLSGYFGKVSDVQKAKWKEIQDANQ